MTGDVKRGDAAAVIFAEAGVDLITTGHVHVPFALPIDLGDHCSYARRLRDPVASRARRAAELQRVDWDDREITVTALAWTGSKFEPQRTWNLERRSTTKAAALRAAASIQA